MLSLCCFVMIAMLLVYLRPLIQKESKDEFPFHDWGQSKVKYILGLSIYCEVTSWIYWNIIYKKATFRYWLGNKTTLLLSRIFWECSKEKRRVFLETLYEKEVFWVKLMQLLVRHRTKTQINPFTPKPFF